MSSELAALGLEGEDGAIHVRDLGFLHKYIPHLRTSPNKPQTLILALLSQKERGKGNPRKEGEKTSFLLRLLSCLFFFWLRCPPLLSLSVGVPEAKWIKNGSR